jgi:hypothetical protein
MLAALGAAAAGTGCISGRVLSGYPGYPFASFSVNAPVDTIFFELQGALADEGYPVDYTQRDAGLINTQPGPDSGKPIYLNIVIGADSDRDGWTAVWVAGYEHTPAGPRRVNPLDETLWAMVMDVSGRLSDRLGGTEPLGPDERAARESTPATAPGL